MRPIRGAFTLLELLAVIAVIGLLTALVFGAAGGARERSRRARAGAELAVLAQALEYYCAQFGDFPRTGAVANDPAGAAAADDGPGVLFNALTGRHGTGVVLVPTAGRCLVTLSAHSLQTADLPGAGAGPAQSANAFLDPWGRRYVYCYRTGPAWTRPTPQLVSAGADGAVALPADLAAWDGAPPSGEGANADNLSAFEPGP